jgi:hypothetical protein
MPSPASVATPSNGASPPGGASPAGSHRTPPPPGSYGASDPAAAPSGYQIPEQSAGGGSPLLATTVEAAAELAEICLSLSARAIRAALVRLPRP